MALDARFDQQLLSYRPNSSRAGLCRVSDNDEQAAIDAGDTQATVSPSWASAASRKVVRIIGIQWTCGQPASWGLAGDNFALYPDGSGPPKAALRIPGYGIMSRETDKNRPADLVRDNNRSKIPTLPSGKLAPPWLHRKLTRPPRKIEKWVAKTHARYAAGRGWYVEVLDPAAYPPLSNPRGGAAPWNFEALAFLTQDEIDRGLSAGLGHYAIAVEPPCNWPVSNDIRTTLALERLTRVAEGYEGLPGQIKDPAEDTIVTRLLAWATAVFYAIVHRHH